MLLNYECSSYPLWNISWNIKGDSFLKGADIPVKNSADLLYSGGTKPQQSHIYHDEAS